MRKNQGNAYKLICCKIKMERFFNILTTEAMFIFSEILYCYISIFLILPLAFYLATLCTLKKNVDKNRIENLLGTLSNAYLHTKNLKKKTSLSLIYKISRLKLFKNYLSDAYISHQASTIPRPN